MRNSMYLKEKESLVRKKKIEVWKSKKVIT